MQLTPLKPSIPYSLFPIHRDGIGNVEQESGNRELGRQYTILGPGPRYSALGQKRGVLEHIAAGSNPRVCSDIGASQH